MCVETAGLPVHTDDSMCSRGSVSPTPRVQSEVLKQAIIHKHTNTHTPTRVYRTQTHRPGTLLCRDVNEWTGIIFFPVFSIDPLWIFGLTVRHGANCVARALFITIKYQSSFILACHTCPPGCGQCFKQYGNTVNSDGRPLYD